MPKKGGHDKPRKLSTWIKYSPHWGSAILLKVHSRALQTKSRTQMFFFSKALSMILILILRKTEESGILELFGDLNLGR